MSSREQPRPSTLTSTQIAQIANVTPSAVSNWKRRHPDFPANIDDGLYATAEIVSWLRRQGRTADFDRLASAEAAFWAWADRIRGILPVDQMPEVLLQLFALRAAEAGKIERLEILRGFWAEMSGPIRENMGAVHDRLHFLLGKSDPELFDALRVSPALHQLDTHDWHQLVDLVDQRDPSTTDWGALATSLVVGFLREYGAKGGVFSTGSDLVDILKVFLSPLEGKVYDPAFGAGVFLASAWRDEAQSIERLYGQELVEQSWRVGFLHLLLLNADFDLRKGDTLVDDRFRDLRADRIAVDPPLGLKPQFDPTPSDPRWSWGIPSKGSADLLWAEHVAFHLSDDGIGVVLVSPGSLARHTEQHVRAGLVGAGLVEMVVQLPPGTLAATSIAPCLVVLRKAAHSSGQVLFIDARQLGTAERGGFRTFASDDIEELTRLVQDWRSNEFAAEPQLAGAASIGMVLDNQADLTPTRYVPYDEAVTHIDGERIAHRYQRLDDEAREATSSVVSGGLAVLDEWMDLHEAQSRIGYEPLRLGDLLKSEPTSGVRMAEEGEGLPIPYVETEAVSQGPPFLTRVPGTFRFGEPKDRMVERGDLLLVSRGVERLVSIPCAKIDFDGRAAYSQSLLRLRVNGEFADPDYLRLYLSSRRGAAVLAAAATGSVISNLRPDALSDVEIHMPDLATQKRVVEEFVKIEQLQVDLRAALSSLQSLHETGREGVVNGLLSPMGEVND